VDADVLRKMIGCLAYRGPDDEGVYVDGCLGLGHRRLAIIDLSPAGHQPMETRDGRYVISYNGEVYNFRELRTELEGQGYTFESQTDTEVVLNAYVAWGTKAVERFNGMFALVIWDRTKQELFLARDRYGIKPLYYTFAAGALLLASESKAFLQYPDFRVQLDKEALLEYFTFQNFFTDRTLFKGVRIVPAGHHAVVKPSDAAGSRVSFQMYWDYNFAEPTQPCDEAEYVEELDRLFRQAVRRQFVSDVEIGSYLSGGMDSGSITALAALQFPYLRTFTCGFDLHSASGLELAFDEREKAELMSYLFKTEHYEMVLKAGDMERVLSKVVWHLDEPRIGQSYPNYYAAQLAGKFVKVVLSGGGGDELFGGYPWRYYRAAGCVDFEDYVDKYYVYWHRLMDNQHIKRVFQPVWADVSHVWTRDIFRDVFHRRGSPLMRPEDYINHSLYLEAKTFLHGLLVVEDKLSMAHSLETRVPFLDNDLVDFAVRLPVKLKLRSVAQARAMNENDLTKYQGPVDDGKMLLRKMLERYVPPDITRARKQGFSAPDASWFKGESIDYVRRLLFDDQAHVYAFIDRATVREMVTEHLDGRENRRLLIWSLLSFEWWLRTFLK
jgi:asparagine synthase (glutamine-hydrolysing)